jgi:exodeoxyribonuclease III
MRVATWNVNSVRARLDRIISWMERRDVDVLALQETKCPDELFPTAPFEDRGYAVATHGISRWNGVALISRVGLIDVRRGLPGMPRWGEPPVEEARALGALCGDVRVWSLYVPNGRALDHPHLAYKLEWLTCLRGAVHDWVHRAPAEPLLLVGDWNVAPLDEDVWDMAAFEGLTHVSPEERAAFGAVLEAGLEELTRPFLPGPGVYTYWDYQRLRFPRRQGMRIDFALGSPALRDRVTGAMIDRDERRGTGASDHAPVLLDLRGELPEGTADR